MNQYILVCTGGALGSIARYGVGRFVTHKLNKHAVLGTIFVNLTGAFILGLVIGLEVGRGVRLLAVDGFLGAFTTFSALMFEGRDMVGKDKGIRSLFYIFGSIAAGTALFIAGTIIGRLAI